MIGFQQIRVSQIKDPPERASSLPVFRHALKVRGFTLELGVVPYLEVLWAVISGAISEVIMFIAHY